MADAVEGECRMRIQCNLCGRIDEVDMIVPEGVRDQVAEFIREDPDAILATFREASSHALGWNHHDLPDGGVVDICPDCLEHP